MIRTLVRTALAIGVLLLPVTVAALSAPVLEGEQRIESTEGHATIAWSPASGESPAAEYELVSAATSRFEDPESRYRGADLASFVSGLPKGETWFRVRAIDASGNPGPWSEPMVIEVTYPSRAEVLRMLGLGALVLIATVSAVLAGHFKRTERST